MSSSETAGNFSTMPMGLKVYTLLLLSSLFSTICYSRKKELISVEPGQKEVICIDLVGCSMRSGQKYRLDKQW